MFRKTEAFQLLVFAAMAWLLARAIIEGPDRRQLPDGTASVHFEAARLAPGGFAPLRLAGAWLLSSEDQRFGGLSALALDGDALIGLTDSGVVIRMRKPAGPRGDARAMLIALPAGPCSGAFKSCRDSEALTADPLGRGWWVAFENRNQIWLYDRSFRAALARVDFGRGRWRRNRGIEGLATEGDALVAFPEAGNELLRIEGGEVQPAPFSASRLSDALRLPDARVVILERGPSLRGFSNRLALVKQRGSGYVAVPFAPLGVGPLDNMEGMAAERLPTGAVRLWIVSDDNFQRPMRTLLIALDLPATRGRT